MPLAAEIEREMQSMAEDFSTNLAPRMADCSRLCQSTPCGGLSWLVADGEAKTLHLDGSSTPCGKLAAATMDFVGLTLETRPDTELGSRAACFLRLARKHQMPLIDLRKSKEGGQAMREAFAMEKVPTPWLKTEAEYQQYREMKAMKDAESSAA